MKVVSEIIDDPFELKEHNLTKDQANEIRYMLGLLKDFDGNMSETSVTATVYSYW